MTDPTGYWFFAQSPYRLFICLNQFYSSKEKKKIPAKQSVPAVGGERKGKRNEEDKIKCTDEN